MINGKYVALTLSGIMLLLSGCQKDNVDIVDAIILESNEATDKVSEETAGLEILSGVLSFEGVSVGSDDSENMLKKYGNTSGNLINSGYVCEDSGKLYYYNKNDNKSLYVMNIDGSDAQKVGNIQGAMELNINGGYLYYQAGGIYRYSFEDNQIDTLVNDNCRNMVVTENYIFYIRTESDVSRIYRMNLSDGAVFLLSEDMAGYLNVKGEYVYFINGTDSGSIYRMGLDGSNPEKLNDATNVSELLVEDSAIYFVSSSNSGNKLYKMPKEGGDGEVINENSISNINMNGGYLFYFNATDSSLCYSYGNGQDEKQLYVGKLNAINVTNEWVYFFNAEDFQYYRIRKNGNDLAIVE